MTNGKDDRERFVSGSLEMCSHDTAQTTAAPESEDDAELTAAIRRGIEDVNAGRVHSAEEVRALLRARVRAAQARAGQQADTSAPAPAELRASVEDGLADQNAGRTVNAEALLDELGGLPASEEDIRTDWPDYRLDEWLNDNNPPSGLQYGGAFWSYVETVKRIAHKFGAAEVYVVDTYDVRTPPPEETLTLPAIALVLPHVRFAIRWDFGFASWAKEWTVSVDRRSPFLGPLFGLFDPDANLGEAPIRGFGSEWTFPSYRQSPARFTCEVEDEADVTMLVRLMTHGP